MLDIIHYNTELKYPQKYEDILCKTFSHPTHSKPP